MKAKPFIKRGEGMWLLNNLPINDFKKYYKFNPDSNWVDRVQKSCVRMNNGGSASFVSSDGLLVTNHHVAAGVLFDLSTPEHDYLRDGFYAKNLDDEIQVPELEVNVLWSITDVTDRVKSAIISSDTASAQNLAKRAVITDIETESKQATGLRSDVVTLYNGGLYHLYCYKRYTDVRLVWAPEAAIAHFGGDIDNFEFPRYCLDVSFLRVYENGKPLHTPHYFNWQYNNAPMDNVLFIAGHPGRTDRISTAARVEYLRDSGLPNVLNYLRRLEINTQQYAGRSIANAAQARDDLKHWENARKSYTYELAALQTPSFTHDVISKENNILELLKSKPELKNRIVAWQAIEQCQKTLLEIRDELHIFEGARGMSCSYFGFARTLVRMATEDSKANNTRLEEYSDAKRESLMQRLYSPAPIYSTLEQHNFEHALSYMLEKIGANDPLVIKILDGKSPSQFAAWAVGKTKLASIAFRKKIARGGLSAVQQSTDPFIILAQLVDERARAVRLRLEEEIDLVEESSYSTISQTLFDLYGTSLYPDATFTLRLTYGDVTAYSDKAIAPNGYTTISQIYDHATKHNNQGSWKLPNSWVKNRSKLQKDSNPFNFTTSHDTHGGNSGSPVFDANCNIIGLLFDGTTAAMGDTFQYMDNVDHAVSVHTAGISSVLQTVYKTNRLIHELKKGSI